MFLKRTLAMTTLLGVTSLLAGCFDSDGSPAGAGDEASPEDQAAIEYVMTENETNTELGTMDVLSTDESDDGGAQAAPINTLRWRREVQSVDRSWEIHVENPSDGPATADVTVSGTILGLLHLWGCGGDSLLYVTKPFDDSGSRRMLFEKVRPITAPTDVRHRGWKLTATSGVELASEGATRVIRSVRVQAGDVDRTFTDMSELVRVQDLMMLPETGTVLVEVVTGDPTDAVYVHVRRAKRIALTDDDQDGVFTGEFELQSRRGPRHFAVDVLSHGTLYDDTEAYDNVIWGIPYLVVPTDVSGSGNPGSGNPGNGGGV
jgi:hypothetical protein